jgi:hypothetical protein
MPAVPQVPGVPSLSSYSVNNIELATSDSLIALNAIVSLFAPQWGIYVNGQAVITPASILSGAAGTILSEISQIASAIGLPNIVPTIASTIEFDYSADSPISNYPQEQGAFQSYDKVQLPSEINLQLACSGSTSQRQAFLNTLEALRTSTQLVDIMTPEQVYSDYNLSHYDLKRSANSGVTMITANAKFELVPITASATPGSSTTSTTTISNPQQPYSASPQSLGNVQPQSNFPLSTSTSALSAPGGFF